MADGPLQGWTIGQLLDQFPEPLLGPLAQRFRRFPLPLKFLDAHEMLSVQVHPTDANQGLLPAGETAKTEAWVVLEAATQSRIYAGLKAGTTAAGFRSLACRQQALIHSEARRRRFPAGWDGSLSGRRRRGVRDSAEQRRDVSSFRLGPC